MIIVVFIVDIFSTTRAVEGSSDVDVVEGLIYPRVLALSSEYIQIFRPLLTILASKTFSLKIYQNAVAYLNFAASSNDWNILGSDLRSSPVNHSSDGYPSCIRTG